MRIARLVVAGTLVTGCASNVVESGDSGTTSLPPPATSTGPIDDSGETAPEEDPAEGSGTHDGSGDGFVADVAAGDDSGTGSGCLGVDFLFVIDSSASMEDQQAALVGAFPGFMDAIGSTLAADTELHIMVVDTDDWGRCDTANGWEGQVPGHDSCNDYITNTVFDECDRTWGAGVVHPAGQFASNEFCTIAGGNRYIVPGDPDMAGTFACMATVGVAGHTQERPMDALVAALAPEINAAGGCNAGFLRSDALLVITLLSDDSAYHDMPGPTDWYQAVVDAKGGDPSSVVVLGLTPDWDGCSQGNGGTDGAHWTEFIEMFGDNGLRGNVCGSAPEYVDFFQSAVSTIDQACRDFEPEG
ncbi:MAG: hypothetical protein AAF721_22800 [Myxococcota bacterium]